MSSNPLPIYEVESELLEALGSHRVVVVEAPTGSGKTTQIPRMLLAGLDPRCIAVTQPRRIAAVSVAWRIAYEERVVVGEEVGYGIRFDDQSCAGTRIRVMTDGLMLSEARTDPDLSRYDIIMVDEAHERSLNIDVTLGLLYDLLGRREDLRVLVSSATMVPEHFQDFFRPVVGDVPLITARSEPYPVEIVWRPVSSTHPEDLADEISQGIASIHRRRPPGHILVFLPGEGLIHRISTAVEELGLGSNLVVLPLFGRLTREEQERVFDDFGDKRKVVLATNIAETSITVPDVRYVIDTGLAKVPRFQPKSGITQLREEPISRSSIMQRTGRAGRTAPGIVFRLFSEASLEERPERTEEEIRRLDLAEVVLRLLDLGIDNVEDFHFPTRPPAAKVRAALEHLQALGAVDDNRTLTRIGRRMAPFPLTPALARMVIEAAERFESVVDDVLVVGAFMSGRSPWLIPEGEFDAARRAHARLHHRMGDACSELAVYRSWERARDKDRFCRRNFLDPEVMQFTRKAHEQLREIAEKQGITLRGGGSAEDLVKAVATGLADKVLRRDENAYQTINGARVALHPGSALVRNPPDFAVAAELVAYARPYAINVSVMRPSWVASASPKAARAFGLGRAKASGGRRRPAITEIELGGITFDVSRGQGKPTIEITLDQIAAVRQADPEDLPPAARKLRGRVRWTDEHCFAALPLPKLLRALRFSPFPKPGSTPPENLALGDLHSYDRGRHYIERDLEHLLEHAVQGKTAGWVALVASGGGGCWLDVVFHYVDAIETSLVSLRDLEGELYPGDELLDRVVETEQRMVECLEATEAV